jgi:hypothetical protein
MWEAMLTAVDQRIQFLMGDVFDQLGDESLKCLRTQMIWSELAPHLREQCDASPAVSAVKAIEIELRERLVTPVLIDAVAEDLEEHRYPVRVDQELRRYLGSIAPQHCCLGQAVGILRGLARCRQEDLPALKRSRAGQYLRRLEGGYRLLDWKFVNHLQEAVSRYRNPSAHGPISGAEAASFNQLLFGTDGEGLLAFLIRASSLHRDAV